MKSAAVLALLLGVQAQRDVDTDAPGPIFKAAKVLGKCEDKAGAVAAAYAAYTAAVSVQAPYKADIPGLQTKVTEAIAATDVLVKVVIEFEKVDGALEVELKKDDLLDKTELEKKTALNDAIYALASATNAQAAAQSSYDTRLGVYTAAKSQYDKVVLSETDEKTHQTAENSSTDADLILKNNAIAAYGTDDPQAGSLGTFTARTITLAGHKQTQTAGVSDIATKLSAKTAANLIWTDSKLLLSNQVIIVDTAGYTTGAGGTANVSYTPKGGSSTSTPSLGVALAIKIKDVTDLVAAATLNGATVYTNWKAKADLMVNAFALAKAEAAKSPEEYHLYDAAVDYGATGVSPTWSGGTAAFECLGANKAAATDGNLAACKAACDAIGAAKAWDSANPDAFPVGTGFCIGIQWKTDSKCFLMYTSDITSQGSSQADTSCYKRDQSVYQQNFYVNKKLIVDSLQGLWDAKYDGTKKWEFIPGADYNAYKAALDAQDVAQNLFDQGRQLEWRYKYQSEKDGDQAAVYLACPARRAYWVANADKVSAPAFTCEAAAPAAIGSDSNAGTGTIGLYKAAFDAHASAVSDQTAKDDAYNNYLAGDYDAAKLDEIAKKKTRDDTTTAYAAQLIESGRQDKIVLQVTASMNAQSGAVSTLDTEVGVTLVGGAEVGLKKALTDAKAVTLAKQALKDTAQNEFTAAELAGTNYHSDVGGTPGDYATKVTAALATLKGHRDAADAENDKLVLARKAVVDKNVYIADEQVKIDALDVTHTEALVKCREEKYDEYRTTLDEAEKARAKTLEDIKAKMEKEAKDMPAAGSGKSGARCEKARSNGDRKMRAACGENLCCGAAKGSVGGAVMTIETCQKTDAKTYTYKPPRAPMALDDDADLAKSWPFACIAGAARVAAAATALATSAYLMA